jgi:CBS domain containing-hemolysin-like protein
MFEIVLIFILVLAMSFVCSLAEAAFMTTNSSFVALALKEQKAYAKILEHLKENVNKPITAIITFNTISNTLGSALLATMTYEKLGSVAVSVLTGLLTFGILVLSEILPKILGASYWKTLIPFVTYVIQIMIVLIYPIVWISEFLSKRFDISTHGAITREEMIASAELSAEEGEIRKQESKVIKNLLTLNNLFVSDIMTPRSVVFALDAEETVADVHSKHKPIRFSRIPVYKEDLDHIVGVTMRHQILECVSMDQDNAKIAEITSPAIQVSEKMTVAGLLEYLIKKKTHLAIVIDEYGVVTGLVTLEDAIETLLGVEIVDELDQVTDMRQYALDQWNLRKNQARTP